MAVSGAAGPGVGAQRWGGGRRPTFISRPSAFYFSFSFFLVVPLSLYRYFVIY